MKDYRVVFIFETDAALAKFLDSGWAGETQADAAAKQNVRRSLPGAAMAAQVWVYQITRRVSHSGDSARHQVLEERRPQPKVVPHWCD